MSHTAAIALLRNFTRSLALVGAGLVLLTLVLAASLYRIERERALVQARTSTLQQAARLGALVAPFVQHTERMRAFMQQRLARGFDTPPADICDRLYTVPTGGAGFGGTFLRDPMRAEEPPYGVVAASTLIERRGLRREGTACRADPELATALRLLEDLRIDHASNPALTRSYYNSAQLDLAASFPAYPLEQTRASASARNARSADELLVVRPAGSILWRLGPEQNPARALVWSNAYVDRGGGGTMVTLARPVYAGAPGAEAVYYGAVGTDLPLHAVAGFLQQLRLPAGRIYVVTPGGDVIGSSTALPEYELQHFAALVPVPLAAAVDAVLRGALNTTAVTDGSLGSASSVATGRDRALVAGIEGTPWRLVYVATDADIAGAIAPSLLAYSAALLALLAAALAGLWSFRRRFLQPAVAIFESTQGDEELLIAGTRDTPWQPIAGVLARTREATRIALEHIDAQGRLKQAVFEASLDCIVTADEQGRVLDCNPAAERVFGFARAQLIGRPMGETIVPHRYRHLHEAGMERYVATGRRSVLGKRIEIEGLRSNGESFPLELAIAEAGVGSGRVFVAFIRDLTDRKAVEAEVQRQRDVLYQKEKMAALGSMLAGVSHELNNPLSVVVGRASMLEEDVVEPQLKDSVRRLRAAAERCGRIVKTFLAMARQSTPQRQPVQVARVLDGALEVAGYGLRSNGIEVCREDAAALPEVLADEDQLTQVFMNLVVNAQQAMERKPGPRRLTVRTRPGRPGSDEVVIEFSDTGVGIPADVHQRIFEPFFTTKRQGEGTGLGLPVSLGMIEAHGGRIEIESSVGVGSTFRVCLPVGGGIEGSGRTHAATGSQGGARRRPPAATSLRALVVDEETEVAATIAELLSAEGYECTLLDDAPAALERLEREDFDVILSDLRMPGMNGHDFAVALAARQPRLMERLVFVTGDTLGELRRQVETLGRPIVDKPFGPAELREAVAQVRRLRATEDQPSGSSW